MGWVAAAFAVAGAVASISSSQKAAKSVKQQAANQAHINVQQAWDQAGLSEIQVQKQAGLAIDQARAQAEQINQLAATQAALAAKQTETQVVEANKQAQRQAAFERQRAETEADFIRAVGEANANQVLVREAQEERVLYEQQKQWAATTTARAAASGFTLSGSPSFYMEEANRLYTEDLSWRRRIADADAAGLRWEAQTKGDIGKWASGEAMRALVEQTYDTTVRQYQQGIESNRQQLESIAARTGLEVKNIEGKTKQEVEFILERNRQEVEHITQRAEAGVEAANAQASAIKMQGFSSALSQIGTGLTAFSAAGGFNSAASISSTGGVTGGLTQTYGSQVGYGATASSSGIGFSPNSFGLSYKPSTAGSTNFLLGR